MGGSSEVKMKQEFEQLMSLMREPALCVRDGRIECCNTAAVDILPGLSVGEQASAFLPNHILGSDANEWAAIAKLACGVRDITASRSGDALIVIIREPEETGPEGFDYMLLASLQSELFSCRLAIGAICIELMDKEIALDHLREPEEDDEPVEVSQDLLEVEWLSDTVRAHISALLHNHFCMQRSLTHLALKHTPLDVEVGPYAGHCSLPEVLSDVVSTSSIMLYSTGVKFDFSTPIGSLEVALSLEVVEHVSFALISDAVQRMTDGGTLRFILERDDEYAHISFIDDPKGSDEGEVCRESGLELARAVAASSGGILLAQPLQSGFAVKMSIPLFVPHTYAFLNENEPKNQNMDTVLTELSPVLKTEKFLVEYIC